MARRLDPSRTGENPYALDKEAPQVGSGKRHPPTSYSAEEVVRLVEGYNRVDDPALWPGIPRGAHVRFIKKDGKFLTGGFLHNYHKDEASGEEAFFIENGFDPRASTYAKFKLAFANLQTVFVKNNSALVSVSDFGGIMRSLISRVESLERNQARLAKLVGLLSEKK
jgi:hypothetical protein